RRLALPRGQASAAGADHRRDGPVHGPRPRPPSSGHPVTDRYAGRPMAEKSAAAAGGKKPGATRRAPDEVRRLLLESARSLVTAQAYESIKELNEASPLSRLMDELEQVAGREAELRGYQFDVHISTRLVAGMVMSMALLDEWLFPTGKRRPSRQRIVNEMVAFMIHGLAHRQEAEEPAEASG